MEHPKQAALPEQREPDPAPEEQEQPTPRSSGSGLRRLRHGRRGGGPAIASDLAGRTGGSSHGVGFWWTFTAALLVFGVMIVAIVQNSHHVRLHFLAWSIDVSLIVVVLTTALIAIFLDEVGGLIWRRRRRARHRRRTELVQLRARQALAEEPTFVPAETGVPEPSNSTERGT